MVRIVETLATAVLLIIVILLITHFFNGTATSWLKSKFVAQE
jgi:hypothetical protein